jgi:hypothetical protein
MNSLKKLLLSVSPFQATWVDNHIVRLLTSLPIITHSNRLVRYFTLQYSLATLHFRQINTFLYVHVILFVHARRKI